MKTLGTMLVKFKSFGPIRRLLDEQLIEVEVPPESTVLQVVQKIADIGGSKLKDLILKNEGIDGNLIVMLNKRDVATLGGVHIRVSEGDEIAILPHVQGG